MKLCQNIFPVIVEYHGRKMDNDLILTIYMAVKDNFDSYKSFLLEQFHKYRKSYENTPLSNFKVHKACECIYPQETF